MPAKYQRKDMGAWGDRQDEARAEKIASASAPGKRSIPVCDPCQKHNHTMCKGRGDHRICRCTHQEEIH